MNDRYLYRAKRIDNGEWVEGLLTIMWGQFHIINLNDENTAYPIDPSTICQCAGSKDKNGELIWENDILCGYLDDLYPENATYEEVLWWRNGFYTREKGSNDVHELDAFTEQNFKVFGNIFDNPELLEVGE